MLQTYAYNYLQELFYSTEVWGYLGPLGIVVIGAVVAKRDWKMGILYFIVEMLIVTHYFSLMVGTSWDYVWHMYIIFFGGLFLNVFPVVFHK